MESLIVYRHFFPDFVPSPFQQDLIEQCVTDIPMWRETLMFWAGNGYRPQSVKRMIDYYDEQLKKRSGEVMQIKSAVGQSTAEPEYNCSTCFDLGTITNVIDNLNFKEMPCPKCAAVRV